MAEGGEEADRIVKDEEQEDEDLTAVHRLVVQHMVTIILVVGMLCIVEALPHPLLQELHGVQTDRATFITRRVVAGRATSAHSDMSDSLLSFRYYSSSVLDNKFSRPKVRVC